MDKAILNQFISQLKDNLYYCDIAIIKMHSLEWAETKENIFEFFFYAEALFNALANIAKILDSDKNPSRSVTIKQTLNIKEKKISNIKNRQFRNTNEHYDERIDELEKAGIQDFYQLDHIITDNFLFYKPLSNFGRIYVTGEKTFYFQNATLKPTTVNMTVIKEELDYLKNVVYEYCDRNNMEYIVYKKD